MANARDVDAQVTAARRAAVAFVRPDRVTLEILGPDRVMWINGLVTCDVLKAAVGDVRYGLFVARSGRVLSDATIALAEARVLISVPARVEAALRKHLDHYLVMEDAEVAPAGRGTVVWEIHGPRSSDVLAVARSAGADAAGALDRTGLGGAVVFAAPDDQAVAPAIERALAAAGGVVGSDEGWRALRLERCVPEFGDDFGETTYPQEAALEKAAVSFNKGCYLGQEVVCMLEMRGHVKRRLASLVIDATEPPFAGAAVTRDGGDESGEVTSAALSPTLGKVVALAMLKRAALEPGQPLWVTGRAAQVVERPA